MPDDEKPARPRRERPLVAPGREPSSTPAGSFAPPTGEPLFASTPNAPEPPARDDHVVISFEAPGLQSRPKVAFRWILSIGYYLFSFVLSLGMQIVAVVAWFAALFTGEVPEGMHRFLT